MAGVSALPDLDERIAPTRRPDRRAVMYQTWRHLLFLHWEVPADALRPLIPPGVEVDTFEGRAYVGRIRFSSERRLAGPRPATGRMAYTPVGEPGPAAPGSLEFFLIERYLLYTSR